MASLVDAYIDARFESEDGDMVRLREPLAEKGVETHGSIEAALRDRRASYGDLKDLLGECTTFDVECYHVDYSSKFFLYVPENYSPKKTYSLVVVGHGGNSSMDAKRAMSTAKTYIERYAPSVSKGTEALVIAPASVRGWGNIDV